MDGLDLSGLTDDQLVELARLVIDEALRRNSATAAATEDHLLSAAEQLRIRHAAQTLDVRAARALERERLTIEARAAARIKEDEARAAMEAKKAAAERARVAKQNAELRAIIEKMAALTGCDPSILTLVKLLTNDIRNRMIVKDGPDFSAPRLVDWTDGGTIKTCRAAVKHKPELAELCAKAWRMMKVKSISGDDLS